MSNKICKIVYFDEDSVTDYVQIVAGGTLEKTTEYYEFVGTKGKSKVILRFNINSFKNGYTISDLLKMNLSIYAIKVGRTTLDMLNVSKELSMDVSIVPKDNPSYIKEETFEESSTSAKVLDVFDVLLAGVESLD